MKCTNCSQTINEGDKFCANCGNAILSVQTAREKKLLTIASSSQRLANYFLDTIFASIAGFIIGFIIGIIFELIDPSLLENSSFLLGISFVFGYITMILYYTTLESKNGKSIGKYITKTKVVKKNGDKIKFRDAFIRSICRLIPFDAISFLGNNPIGWHDSIAKTIVVIDR
jgi:uncharacterized RDD family membrane protein YckC